MNFLAPMRYIGVLGALFFTGCLPEVETIDPASIVEWKNFTTTNGLAGNRVNAITADSNGDLWLATDNGVSKYDGVSFTSYRTTDGLANDFVTSVVEFAPGTMVFGTTVGLSVFEDGYWFNITDLDGNGTPFGVTAMVVDDDGLGWFATDVFGLLFIDDSGFYQVWDSQCFPCNFVNYIYKTPRGELWFATQGGLKVLRGNIFTLYTTNDGLPDDYIQTVFEDSWGTLWVGTYNGMAKKSGNSFLPVSLYNSAPQNWVYTINQDIRKKVWYGAIGNGLIYNDGASMRTEPASLEDYRKSTLSSFRDAEGALWFGTYAGGLYKYTPK